MQGTAVKKKRDHCV